MKSRFAQSGHGERDLRVTDHCFVAPSRMESTRSGSWACRVRECSAGASPLRTTWRRGARPPAKQPHTSQGCAGSERLRVHEFYVRGRSGPKLDACRIQGRKDTQERPRPSRPGASVCFSSVCFCVIGPAEVDQGFPEETPRSPQGHLSEQQDLPSTEPFDVI